MSVIKNESPEFARSNSKNECRRTDNAFPPCMRLALGRWPFSDKDTDGAFLWGKMYLRFSKNRPLTDSLIESRCPSVYISVYISVYMSLFM